MMETLIALLAAVVGASSILAMLIDKPDLMFAGWGLSVLLIIISRTYAIEEAIRETRN